MPRIGEVCRPSDDMLTCAPMVYKGYVRGMYVHPYHKLKYYGCVIHNMALKHVFGETPVIKILDFLINHMGHDYSKTEIAERVGIGWTTISRHWDGLLDWKLVTPTRQIGRATMYKLNEDNLVIMQMLKFDEVATTYWSERHTPGNIVLQRPDSVSCGAGGTKP